MALACPSRTSWRKFVFTTIFLVRGPTGLVGGSASAHTGAARAHPARSVAVVERVDSCASLYSRSIQGHHVCLLVKKVSPRQPLLCLHPAPPTGGSPSSAAECRLAAPPSPGELVVAHTIGLLSPVRALVARGGSSSPSCSVGERLCACDSCFFPTRFAELTRETVQAWSLLF